MPSLVQSPEKHLSQLSNALSTLSRARQAVPNLVASVSTPLAPVDRANLYRTAAAECHVAIKQLADELEQLEGVLKEAEESEKKDPKGIVVRQVSKSERNTTTRGTDPWETVGQILGGMADSREKGKQPYRPHFDVPSSPKALADLTQRWQADHPRVRIELAGIEGAEQQQITVTLRGVLRAMVKLRWEGQGAGSRSCEADWVCVYSLKEDRSSYLPSRFSLFQDLTAQAMSIVDRCRQLRADGVSHVGSIEELLAFLSDPPLPF